MSGETLSNLSREDRRFPPPPELAARANVTAAAYDEAATDSEAFWAAQAARLDWAAPWTQVLDWSRAPFARWFTGGRLNVTYNCLDRHVAAGLGDRVASALRALPGISAEVVDDAGDPVPNGAGGYLVLTEPWPSMLRTIWGDEQRYLHTYWSRFPGRYFAGDGAKKDEDGDIWLLGLVDDVMNVSGHRISTTEVESALVSHPLVAEAAVVGASDATTGQGIVAFVILRGEGERVAAESGGEELARELRAHVAKEIGPIARPRQLMLAAELPKTRSGKIMRLLLRDVAENRSLGDVTTLTDSTVMDAIRERLPSGGSGSEAGVDE